MRSVRRLIAVTAISGMGWAIAVSGGSVNGARRVGAVAELVGRGGDLLAPVAAHGGVTVQRA